ncbi:NUDIX domain-containing protein [Halobacterium wangiae]|uniref:NUDIX domain-containing protein n=1 Tax=Halobacterium wangiae TaxID=2902623 RepID=UPI001E5C3157|nr:NUDIX domain-containing protein [Halobacterium wangiae]
MTVEDWPRVRAQVAERTDRVLADLRADWGTTRTVDTLEFGPRSFDPDEPPATVEDQLERIGGIASVIVFYTATREETVLVYNPGGFWEPPGGVVERDQTPADAARAEAREETGLDVELTDLLYTGRIEFQYANGASVPLPLAQFVGHRVDGSLEIEREGSDHPGVTRATGLFDAATLPEDAREHDEIRRLLADTTD